MADEMKKQINKGILQLLDRAHISFIEQGDSIHFPCPLHTRPTGQLSNDFSVDINHGRGECHYEGCKKILDRETLTDTLTDIADEELQKLSPFYGDTPSALYAPTPIVTRTKTERKTSKKDAPEIQPKEPKPRVAKCPVPTSDVSFEAWRDRKSVV